MLTLTFANNTQDLSAAHYEFMLFVQRLNDYCFGSERSLLRYLAVPEFQKRGAVHYHVVLFNLPHLKNVQVELKEIWGKGMIFISKVRGTNGLTKYLSKYITKAIADDRLRGRKRYFASLGLLRPVATNDDATIGTILDILPAYTKAFNMTLPSHQRCGDIDYTRYVLPDDRHLASHILHLIKKTGQEIDEITEQVNRDTMPSPTDAPDVEAEAFPSIAL
jgi:hypothetical protein